MAWLQHRPNRARTNVDISPHLSFCLPLSVSRFASQAPLAFIWKWRRFMNVEQGDGNRFARLSWGLIFRFGPSPQDVCSFVTSSTDSPLPPAVVMGAKHWASHRRKRVNFPSCSPPSG